MSSKAGSQSTGVLIGLLIGLVVGAIVQIGRPFLFVPPQSHFGGWTWAKNSGRSASNLASMVKASLGSSTKGGVRVVSIWKSLRVQSGITAP